VTKTLVLL